MNLKLDVSNSDDNWKDEKVVSFEIDMAADKLDLGMVSEQLC